MERTGGIKMEVGVCLVKGLADLTFGGAFLWYLVKFLVSMALAGVAVMAGIKLRKRKNDKKAAVAAGKEA